MTALPQWMSADFITSLNQGQDCSVTLNTSIRQPDIPSGASPSVEPGLSSWLHITLSFFPCSVYGEDASTPGGRICLHWPTDFLDLHVSVLFSTFHRPLIMPTFPNCFFSQGRTDFNRANWYITLTLAIAKSILLSCSNLQPSLMTWFSLWRKEEVFSDSCQHRVARFSK